MPLNAKMNQEFLTKPAILGLAFRPLFLFGTLFSVIAIAWWTTFWTDQFSWTPYGGTIWWHGHEMLFGFVAAIVTGFLLTAVRVWTGVTGIKGWYLAALVSVWLAGRFVISFNIGLPYEAIATIDVGYLLLSAIAMAYPVLKVKQWRNLMFIPILLILASLNATSHWSVITAQPAIGLHALDATILIFILVIAILGGRVIPAFTANGTGIPKKPTILWLELTAILSILAMAVIAFMGFEQVDNNILLSVSIIAAILNVVRFSRWGIQHTLSTPLLWSLHFSYSFIPLGFIMLALYGAGYIENVSAALHCFTVGTIGGMILAMISRVTLGHTGRALKPHKFMNVAFVTILLAGVVRVIFPAWFSEFYRLAILISGIGWVIAYAGYVIFYTKMLVTHRVDGKPG